MKAETLTIEEVKAEIYYQDDSAYLDSDSFVSDDNESYEDDEVFNAAVEMADQELSGYEMIEIEGHGKGLRAIWHKIAG